MYNCASCYFAGLQPSVTSLPLARLTAFKHLCVGQSFCFPAVNISFLINNVAVLSHRLKVMRVCLKLSACGMSTAPVNCYPCHQVATAAVD